jgi:putative aldouronate transport system substrate-binding protein
MANAENPGWNVTICDPIPNMPKQVNSYINNGVAININSKHAERAMMVLNEFYTTPRIHDMTRFGIEGKHWEAVGDDQYKQLEAASNFGVDNNCNWGWMNANIKRQEYIENRTSLDDKVDEIAALWDANVKQPHPYDGFNFNVEPVSTQAAAVQSVMDSYFEPLKNGLVNDVDTAISDLKTLLDNAGMQDILVELDKQAAEYVAAK